MSAASSQGSEASTSASNEPDTASSSSASPTPTDDGSSHDTGRESRALRMFVHSGGATYNEGERPGALTQQSASETSAMVPLILSVEASPAKTSPSPASEEDSTATDRGSSLSSPESLGLFDPSGYSSRTYPDSSPRTAVGTSESCLERWPTSGMAWDGGFSTAVTSECRSADGECSSSETHLADVLEPSVAEKFYLSAKAARGILRRAEKRGRELPPALAEALRALASANQDDDKRTTRT